MTGTTAEVIRLGVDHPPGRAYDEFTRIVANRVA